MRAQLATAQKWGISLKRLNGWVPKQKTKVTAWTEGNASEWETVDEQEWDSKQRAWALAYQFYLSTLCPKCGSPLHESTDPDSDPEDPTATHPYVAEVDICYSCVTLGNSERSYSESQVELDRRRAPYLIHSVMRLGERL